MCADPGVKNFSLETGRTQNLLSEIINKIQPWGDRWGQTSHAQPVGELVALSCPPKAPELHATSPQCSASPAHVGAQKPICIILFIAQVSSAGSSLLSIWCCLVLAPLTLLFPTWDPPEDLPRINYMPPRGFFLAHNEFQTPFLTETKVP